MICELISYMEKKQNPLCLFVYYKTKEHVLELEET